MGLEALNFFFCTGERIKDVIQLNPEIKHLEGNKYVLSNENKYWIDIQLQSNYSLSIQITLCNPRDSLLLAIHNLLLYLFRFREAILNNPHTKEVFNTYNDEVREKIINSYEDRKKTFEEIYGSFTAAIGSDEFYRIQIEEKGTGNDKSS